MKRPVVVFDFDKTLTDKDTIFGYYAFVNDHNVTFQVKRTILLIAALLFKLGIIENVSLKQLGVKLFLEGLTRKELEEKAYYYIKTIELNQIYYEHFLNTPKESRLVVSASYEIYLKKLFPDENVIGSKLAFRKEKVEGLKRNMYGRAKRQYMLNRGIKNIECLYTDSYSDLPIMQLSNKTMIVNCGSIIKILNENFVQI